MEPQPTNNRMKQGTLSLDVGVTGAAGYIGASLVDLLLQQGHRVRALDRFSTGIPVPNWQGGVTVFDIDLSKPGPDIHAFMDGLDFVFDLAAIADVSRCERNPSRCLLHNAVSRVNVLQAVRENGVLGYLLPSSVAAVYGEPQRVPVDEQHPTGPVNTYGLSKVWGESAVRMAAMCFPLHAVVVRQSNVYGPSLVFQNEGVIHRFLARAIGGKPLKIFGSGKQQRDFVFLADLLHAYTELMQVSLSRPPGQIIVNVAGQVATIKKLAEHCIEVVRIVTGKQVPIEYEPARQEAEAAHLAIATGRLKELLNGWNPVPLEQGIKMTLDFILDKESHIGGLVRKI